MIGYKAHQKVDIAPLVVFRIAFGAMMLAGTIRFMWLGWIDDHYLQPAFHFHYYGFEWVNAAGPEVMYGIHILMLLAAAGIMLGAYYRLSALVFFLCFTYTELIDLSYYLNHYYFVSISSFLLILLPAHRYFSIDSRRNPALICQTVPRWCIDSIKLQIAIVYFFAGIAKINSEWLLEALPLRIWLPAQDKLPLLGWAMTYKSTAYLFSWAGMLYDCSIVFWLMNRHTRTLAYLSVIFFHVVTGAMFQIGIFPLVMIASNLIFFSDRFHHGVIRSLSSLFKTRIPVSYKHYQPSVLQNNLLAAFFLLHFSFQLLFPFRYLLYPGQLFWTEEGYRFSWRVMLMEKAGTATFYVKDKNTQREGAVVNREFLNIHQEKQMAMQPDMLLQFAHFLKAHYTQTGMQVSQVRAEVYVTLNGRPSRLLIDPQVDLSSLEDSWAHKKWIMAYEK